MTMIPSNPTLTTPLRSEKTPPKAVNIKGAEYTKVDETIRDNKLIMLGLLLV